MRKNTPNGLKNSKAAAKISLDFAIQDKVAQVVKNHNCNWMVRSCLSWHFLKRKTVIFLILWHRATIRIAISITSVLVAEISKHKLIFYRSRKETISNLKVKRAIIIFWTENSLNPKNQAKKYCENRQEAKLLVSPKLSISCLSPTTSRCLILARS